MHDADVQMAIHLKDDIPVTKTYNANACYLYQEVKKHIKIFIVIYC